MEEAQTQREQLQKSFKETRNLIDALQQKLNRHNEKLQDARAKYNELHEDQLQIQSDLQKLKHLKEKQEDLYTREVSVGETVEKLRKDLADAEDQLNSAVRLLEETKVCFLVSFDRFCFRFFYILLLTHMIILYNYRSSIFIYLYVCVCESR